MLYLVQTKGKIKQDMEKLDKGEVIIEEKGIQTYVIYESTKEFLVGSTSTKWKQASSGSRNNSKRTPLVLGMWRKLHA